MVHMYICVYWQTFLQDFLAHNITPHHQSQQAMQKASLITPFYFPTQHGLPVDTKRPSRSHWRRRSRTGRRKVTYPDSIIVIVVHRIPGPSHECHPLPY
jgi:hypothetical protein